MINFIRIELFKLLRKREFYIIHLCLCCLTLLFEFLIGSNSTIIEGSENSIGGGFFLVFMIEFYSMLFILPIFSAIFVIGIWSKELRNGTLCQMIVRARSRGKVYFSKLIVQTLAVFSVLINVVVISIVGYGIIGRRGAYYSSDFFNVVGEKLIWYLVLNILFLISFSYLVMLISMKNDSTKTLIISVIVLVTLTIIQRIDK